MKKISFILTINLLITFFSFTEILQITNKIAKVGDEIILKNDVDKYARLNNLTFEESKDKLIEKALLYTIVKKEIKEPDEEEIKKGMQDDKLEYASMIGKNANEVSDKEFIENLHYNNISLTTYKEELKKDLWIAKYLKKIYAKNNIKKYEPTDGEIKEFIKKNSELFKEGPGVYLSMIYFSFYNSEGKVKKKNEINDLFEESKNCLRRLENNESFEEMVILYSDDLISKNQNPRGRVGRILFDDPRVERSFGSIIIDELKKSKEGIVMKIFETNSGLYIFRIDDFIEPQFIDQRSCQIKANSIIKKRHIEEQQEEIRLGILEELKKSIKIELFQ